ncbi:MAG: hypothetical protein U5J63_06325 [Fodinibius sp.]|nr:hypothetical protein [Fodinibius sp.]
MPTYKYKREDGTTLKYDKVLKTMPGRMSGDRPEGKACYLGGGGMVFKGDGFYVNDYKKTVATSHPTETLKTRKSPQAIPLSSQPSRQHRLIATQLQTSTTVDSDRSQTHEEALEQFILLWGEMASAWGINHTMAQIHALLYAESDPLDTDAIMEQLDISRGNANMNLRNLLQWQLIHKVHFKGKRRDYYTAEKGCVEYRFHHYQRASTARGSPYPRKPEQHSGAV